MNLYLIDGNSYVYRAFYAIKELRNSKGFPTNAIYGFTNMLLKIIREKKPDGVVVSFDSPEPTERHRLFEAYKAQRPEAPGDLVRQFRHIRDVISAFGIKIFEQPGQEADDLLATIATKAAREGARVLIVTSDKDILQIVGDGISIYDPVKDRVLDEAYVQEKFGVTPDHIPDFMALAGDAVDNIPGVKGIGEKTARELLAQFRDIDDLLAHPEKIKKEKLRDLIAAQKEMVLVSKKLAIIDTALPIEFDINEFRLREPDWPGLLGLFREFEFGSLMKLIPSGTKEHTYVTISSAEDLRALLQSIGDSFAFDVETTGRNPFTDSVVGISLCAERNEAFYVPLRHSYQDAPPQPDKGKVIEILTPIFDDPDIGKIGHNLKFNLMMMKTDGVAVRGVLYDTMIASYLLNPNKPNHSLEEAALDHLSHRKKTFPEVLGRRSSFAEVPVEEATPYASEDAALAFELKGILFDRLRDEGLERLYFEIEMPLIRVLAEIEEAGFKVDAEKLYLLSKEIAGELDSIERRIYFLAGEEFNINSPKQLSTVLFQTLGLKPGKKTKTGFSTELSVLEELAESHDLPREILNYRSLSKLKSTYTDVLPGLIHPKTGRIHTSFNQAATATGRLSSSDPNLQNIPVRGEWGRRIRVAFIAEPGNVLVSADYSQIELRILAHLSGDRKLIESFASGIDIHSRTASEIFRIPIEQVTSEMRRVAKTVNFGVIYGISPFGLSEALRISREEAKRYIDGYFEGHPGVKAYVDASFAEAREKGHVMTLFGRKRAVPEIRSANATTRALGERLAMNSPIQGSAADVIKIAMIAVWKRLTEQDIQARLILQVHDELVLESSERDLDRARELVRRQMEHAVDLSVPLKVDVGSGATWAEAHA